MVYLQKGRRIKCNGVYYRNKTEFANAFGLSISALNYRLKVCKSLNEVVNFKKNKLSDEEKRKANNERVKRWYANKKSAIEISNPDEIDPYECFELNGKPIALWQLARKANCTIKEMYDRLDTCKSIEECLEAR